jgi:hypothetical protein
LKTIANWSRQHFIAARIIIALSHTIIGICATYIGIQLKKNNVFFPTQLFWFFLILFFAVSIYHQQFYSFRLPFYKRKFLDLVILLSGFMMIITTSNQPDTNHLNFYTTLKGSFAERKANALVPVIKPNGKEVRKQWKELKKEMKAGGASGGSIAIAVVVGLILIALVASASCSLACNNQGALSIIVLLGGLAGIFFIMKAIIKSSTRHRNNMKAAAVEPPI